MYECTICHRAINREAHGGEHPSAGDHDPAYHVAHSYGTWHPSLDMSPEYDFSKGQRGVYYERIKKGSFTVSPAAQTDFRILGGNPPNGSETKAREALDKVRRKHEN